MLGHGRYVVTSLFLNEWNCPHLESSYALYTLGFFFNQSVKDDYRRRHNNHNSTVQPNDVAFACHVCEPLGHIKTSNLISCVTQAVTLAGVQWAQTFWYPRAPGQALSPYNRIVVPAVGLIAAVNVLLLLIGTEHLIDFLYLLSYFKLYVSVAKYVPQVSLSFPTNSS